MPIRHGHTTQRASKNLTSRNLRRQRDYNRYSGLGDHDADEHIGGTCIALADSVPKPLRHEDADEHNGCACIPPACAVPEPLRLVGAWERLRSRRRSSSTPVSRPGTRVEEGVLQARRLDRAWTHHR